MRYNVVQGALCELSTKFLHVMQGFGTLLCIKVLNKYQAVIYFKFFVTLSKFFSVLPIIVCFSGIIFQ